MRQILHFPGLLCAAASVTAASAEPRYELVSTAVEYGDLDLSTLAGVRELHRRLRSAAAELCRRERSYNGLPGRLPDGECMRDALAATQAQVVQALAQADRDRTKAEPASRQ